MKSIQIEKNKWEKIDKIVLRVDSADLIQKKDLTINFLCGFENISRGRCELFVKEKKKKQIDSLFIHNDKALMEVNIFLDEKKLENLLHHISLKRNSSKKIKITIYTSDSLMINQKRDLYVQSETKIIINEIYWNIPLL
jgi:hypothetical protein